MSKQTQFPYILTGKKQLGPYPMGKIRKVDKPTTKLTDDIQRVDFRNQGFTLAKLGKLGPVAQKEIARFGFKHPLAAGIWEPKPQLMQLFDGKVYPNKASLPQDPAILSQHIKNLGYFLQADIVSICELPQWAVYSHNIWGEPVECNHKYAILIIVDQNYKTMLGSRGDDWISISQSFLGYSHSALIAIQMAGYIRRLGYPARAHFEIGPEGGYQVIVPPLLLLSGVGEVCRAGIILNPFLGTRFKASVVTTDLPLQPDKPVDFGLQEFCQRCIKCAQECPSKAISFGDKTMHNGYEIWKFDLKRCTTYRVTNQNGASCGRCIKVCPWNKPKGWTHSMVRWFIKSAPLLDKFFIKMDDVFGYGKQDLCYKWWFDLEEIDGVIQIPRKSKDWIFEFDSKAE
jgi:reductive dehalogenase